MTYETNNCTITAIQNICGTISLHLGIEKIKRPPPVSDLYNKGTIVTASFKTKEQKNNCNYKLFNKRTSDSSVHSYNCQF